MTRASFPIPRLKIMQVSNIESCFSLLIYEYYKWQLNITIYVESSLRCKLYSNVYREKKLIY